MNIFDDFYHIWFFDSGMSREYSNIKIELHKNLDALYSAKDYPVEEGFKRVRMGVYSE